MCDAREGSIDCITNDGVQPYLLLFKSFIEVFHSSLLLIANACLLLLLLRVRRSRTQSGAASWAVVCAECDVCAAAGLLRLLRWCVVR